MSVSIRIQNSRNQAIKIGSSKEKPRGAGGYNTTGPNGLFEVDKEHSYVVFIVPHGFSFKLDSEEWINIEFVQVKSVDENHDGWDSYLFRVHQNTGAGVDNPGDVEVTDPEDDVPPKDDTK